MADINSVVAKIVAALDEAQTVAGVPLLSQQVVELQNQVSTLTSANATLQSSLDAANQANAALTNDKAALVAAINAARAAAQAAKDRDAANVEGQAVLDALPATLPV